MLTSRWLTIAILLLLTTTVHAATVQRLSTQELTERSEIVFIGSVLSQTTSHQLSPTRIWTTTNFRVERVLKGSVGQTYSLQQLGGAVGDGAGRLVQKIHGYPEFSTNERVLLFLEKTDTGHLVVTGLAQGKFTLTREEDDTAVTATRDLSDIRHPVNQGRVRHLAGMPGDSAPAYLDQLIDLIEGRRPIARPVLLRFVRPKAPNPPPATTGGDR